MTWISMGRRLAVLTVALAFGLALSACGKKEEEKAAPAPAAEQKAPEQAAPAAQPAPAAPQEAAPAPAPAPAPEAAPAPAPAPESAPAPAPAAPSDQKSDTLEKMKDMGDKADTEMKQEMKDLGDKAGQMKSDKPADPAGDKSEEGPPRDE